MKRILLGIALIAIGVACVKAQDYDDIYYNPKKEKKAEQKQASKRSYYIEDFGSVDVDEYNRRGQYYPMPVDTIGMGTENDEDFVYTQKIQKFYNPTIVVDNADVLADVLNNSYGNVDIVFDAGYPTFASVYGWPGYYNPYYCNPGWSWGWNSSWVWGPSWSWNWGWGPSYAWGWGPDFGWGWGPSYAWGWGPGYGWGWGPSYAWGWGPGYGWGGHHHYADWNPNGHRPNRPGDNWASNTRPGGNAAMRPIGGSSNRRPGSATAANGFYGGSNTNHHRTFGGAATSADRLAGTGTSSGTRYSVGSDGHRRYTGSNSSTVNSGSSANSHRGSSSVVNRNSYSSGSNNNYNSGSSGRSTYSSGRSSSSSSYNSSRSYSSPSRSTGGASRSTGGGGGGRGGRR